jgi:hypothetical protein
MKSKAQPSTWKSSRPLLSPTHDQIAARAETLWRQMGCPESRDEEIWLEAERQLRRSPIPPQFESDDGPEERMEELDEIHPDESLGQETTSL